MNVKGIVFDIDGTLANLGGFVDWERTHHQDKGAYVECGCPPELIEELRERSLFDMINLARDVNLHSMDDDTVRDVQGRVYAAVEEYEFEGIEHSTLMPGCVETLAWIRSRGIAIGLATSYSELVAEKVLKSRGIREYFSAIVGRRPGLRMEPHPNQILKCLKEMGSTLLRVWLSGTASMTSSRRCPQRFGWSPYRRFSLAGRLSRGIGADAVIGGLGELPAVIERLGELR